MILPNKSLDASQAILTVGADIVELLLQSSRTVSSVWSGVSSMASDRDSSVSFEWFVLSLDFLYAVGALQLTPSGTLELVEQ